MKCPEAVAIAQDVLDRISMNKLQLRKGYYIKALEDFRGLPPHSSVQENIDIIEERCTACLLGGFLMSYVRLYNEIKWEDLTFVSGHLNILDNQVCIRNNLIKYFSEVEIKDMETAFEGQSFMGYNVIGTKKDLMSAEFNGLTDEEIMIKVCRNIIANDGIFDPSIPLQN